MSEGSLCEKRHFWQNWVPYMGVQLTKKQTDG